MITATLGQLANAEPMLRHILTTGTLSPRVKYHVAKLARLVADETALFNDERNRLVQKHAKNDEWVLNPGTPELMAFQLDLKEFADQPVKIAFAPILSTDIPDVDGTVWVDLGPLCDIVAPAEEPQGVVHAV